MTIEIVKRNDQWLVDGQVFDTCKEACEHAETLGATEVDIQYSPGVGRQFDVNSYWYEKLVA
jgi:hypothetical protein